MKHIYIYMMALVTMLAMASCSGDDIQYEPGQPVGGDNWGVYFDGGNSSMFPRNSSDPNTLEFVVKRLNTNGALEVPLELNVAKGTFNAPGKVVFANGQDEAKIEVTYEGLELGKLSATLSVPESYTNPYKIKRGHYKQAVTVFEPLLVCDSILFVHNSSTGVKHDIFGNVKSRILQVPGENYFLWENFLGSEITLSFKLDIDNGGTFNAKDVLKSDGGIIPLNHAYTDEYGWTFCVEENPENDDNPVRWTPKGADIGISDYAYFYNYYDGDSFLTIDFQDKTYDVYEYRYVDGKSKLVKTYYGGFGSIWAAIFDGGDEDQYDNFYFYLYYPTQYTKDHEQNSTKK